MYPYNYTGTYSVTVNANYYSGFWESRKLTSGGVFKQVSCQRA